MFTRRTKFYENMECWFCPVSSGVLTCLEVR